MGGAAGADKDHQYCRVAAGAIALIEADCTRHLRPSPACGEGNGMGAPQAQIKIINIVALLLVPLL
ncbi:hypothetical protein AXG53_05480 [Stenotrophomonas sp. KCTC 12332]|nr:hypothetical protein AXG53_05480 [Stenotrophomonas sp. KCTC 12332]